MSYTFHKDRILTTTNLLLHQKEHIRRLEEELAATTDHNDTRRILSAISDRHAFILEGLKRMKLSVACIHNDDDIVGVLGRIDKEYDHQVVQKNHASLRYRVNELNFMPDMRW